MEPIQLQSRVTIKTEKEIYTGLFIQKDGQNLIIKLDSGYNVGINESSILEIKQLQSPEKQKQTSSIQSITQSTDLSTIKILHTGGTIASRVDYKTGGVIADFTPEALLSLFPELQEIAKIESTFMGNMWSDDFRFSDFNLLAKQIQKDAKLGITRFIVTSGTDFLHYLSAALSFILKDVPVGVLVVGAQRSSDRGSSDAGMNLVCAASFLTDVNFKGVAVCMHTQTDDSICAIFPGTQVRKMHSSRRDAFKSINSPILAEVDYTSRLVNVYESLDTIDSDVIPDTLPLFNENVKVGMLYSHPNMCVDELQVYSSFDGLILAGSGLGHFPISEPNPNVQTHKEHTLIRTMLVQLAKKIPVLMSVQTIYGRVHMNVYAPGREMQDMGVLGHGSSMTPETSFIKLAWLLSNYSKQEVLSLISTNMVGELPDVVFVDDEF